LPDLPLSNKRILIVEDEALIAIDLEYAFEDAGATCVGIASDNNTAISLLETVQVDAVLLDYGLADGEAAPTARTACERGIPVVFHSGHASPEDLSRRFPEARILSKPSTVDRIVAALAKACGEHISA